MFVLKAFGTLIAIYACARFTGIAFEWIRIGIDKLSPTKMDKRDRL